MNDHCARMPNENEKPRGGRNRNRKRMVGPARFELATFTMSM